MLPNNIPYLIGETAFHHMGDFDFLKKLVDAAAEVGVNAIKFHLLLNPQDYMVEDHQAVEVIKEWCFTPAQWSEVIDMAKGKGLDTVLLCNDLESVQWVSKAHPDAAAIELHATGINDYFLLEAAAKFNNTVILGSSGSSIDELDYAIQLLRKHDKTDIFLMHGYQNYPTDYREVNLKKMRTLERLFHLPVGYADHTDPADNNNELVSIMGAANGFNVLEKHFTHQFGEKRVDSQSAVSLDQMVKIKQLLATAYTVYGDGGLKMSQGELKYGETGPMKKAIVARKDIAAGETLSLEHVAFKRTNQPVFLKQMQLRDILGAKVATSIAKDEIITLAKVDIQNKDASFAQFFHKE